MKSFLLFSLLVFVFSCLKANSTPEYKFRAKSEKGLAVKAGDIEISNKQLEKEIKIDLYKKKLEIFEIKLNKAKSLLIKKLIKKDPKSKGLTNDQYLEKYIISKIKISQKDIEAFMQEKGVPADQMKNARVKQKVIQYLTTQRKSMAVDKWLAEKTKKSGIDIYFTKPIAPSFEIEKGLSPTAGPDSAKITIIEFSDFQCPYCSKAAAVLKKVRKKYGDKVQLVFKHYPLSFHRHARPAALASLCAHEQNKKKFWEMHDAFFFDKAPLGGKKIIELASEKLKLDKDKFEKCFKNKKYADRLQRDIDQAQNLGITGTPAVYVNGQLMLDALTYEKFVTKIEEILKN